MYLPALVFYSYLQSIHMGTCMQRYFSFLHRKLAEAGAHVVMAVRNTKAANELIKKWQEDWAGKGLPLNIEVYKSYRCALTSYLFFILKCYVLSWRILTFVIAMLQGHGTWSSLLGFCGEICRCMECTCRTITCPY